MLPWHCIGPVLSRPSFQAWPSIGKTTYYCWNNPNPTPKARFFKGLLLKMNTITHGINQNEIFSATEMGSYMKYWLFLFSDKASKVWYGLWAIYCVFGIGDSTESRLDVPTRRTLFNSYGVRVRVINVLIPEVFHIYNASIYYNNIAYF